MRDDTSWARALRDLYDLAPLSIGGRTFPWAVRDALGDWLCPRRTRDDDLVNMKAKPSVKAMQVVKRVQQLPSTAFLDEWIECRYRDDDKALARMFSELEFKFSRERDLYRFRLERGPDAVESGPAFKTVDDLMRRSREKNDQLAHLERRLDSVQHDARYLARSIALFCKALVVVFLVLVPFCVACVDPVALMLSMAFAVPIGVWGFLLVSLVPQYRTLEVFTVYCAVATFGYLVYAVLRTVLYSYGGCSVDWVVVVMVWLLFFFAAVVAAFLVNLVGLKKQLATWQVYETLPTRKADGKRL